MSSPFCCFFYRLCQRVCCWYRSELQRSKVSDCFWDPVSALGISYSSWTQVSHFFFTFLQTHPCLSTSQRCCLLTRIVGGHAGLELLFTVCVGIHYILKALWTKKKAISVFRTVLIASFWRVTLNFLLCLYYVKRHLCVYMFHWNNN